MEKLLVTDEFEILSLYDFEGSFEEVIDFLKKRQEEYTAKHYTQEYQEVKLSVVDKKYEDGSTLAIVGRRLESDKQYNNRVAALKRYKEKRRSLYEELKKEFGDA